VPDETPVTSQDETLAGYGSDRKGTNEMTDTKRPALTRVVIDRAIAALGGLAASPKDARPILEFVHVDRDAGTAFAADGYMLGMTPVIIAEESDKDHDTPRRYVSLPGRLLARHGNKSVEGALRRTEDDKLSASMLLRDGARVEVPAGSNDNERILDPTVIFPADIPGDHATVSVELLQKMVTFYKRSGAARVTLYTHGPHKPLEFAGYIDNDQRIVRALLMPMMAGESQPAAPYFNEED
jgi:hypothetical protein